MLTLSSAISVLAPDFSGDVMLLLRSSFSFLARSAIPLSPREKNPAPPLALPLPVAKRGAETGAEANLLGEDEVRPDLEEKLEVDWILRL
mmetsp:Transcript_547/g.1291  ORF Transcript_547/g.1291 Transcript_547/m.1291 type:complete len:90 (-) Transcript_547:177-446(-)